jgi:hypothetical protein
MTRSFETAQEIREQWFRIEGAENTVRAATADGFRSVRSDVEPEYLAGLVHDLQSFLEHLFAEAFGEDGKAILDGTHELADLKEQLLEEHDLAWLPPRVVELERVVSHGRETVKAAPIIPVGDDHHLAAELQRILENERRGWFVSMYH